MTQRTTAEILGRFYNSNVGAILVEGIPSELYAEIIGELSEQVSKLERPLSKDFLEMLLEDRISRSLRDTENQFVYNFDLFGEGVDPNKSTEIMGAMRGAKNMGERVRQLMIARPQSNLDYNSRKGFSYHDNHPLGNWCEFYSVEGDKLISQVNPIEHR